MAADDSVAVDNEEVAEKMNVAEVASEQEPEPQVTEPRAIEERNKTMGTRACRRLMERKRLVSRRKEERAAIVVDMNIWRARALVKPIEKLAKIERIETEVGREKSPVASMQEPEPRKAEPVRKKEEVCACNKLSYDMAVRKNKVWLSIQWNKSEQWREVVKKRWMEAMGEIWVQLESEVATVKEVKSKLMVQVEALREEDRCERYGFYMTPGSYGFGIYEGCRAELIKEVLVRNLEVVLNEEEWPALIAGVKR
ncbi:hypothetical protein HOY80DRAFT_1030774 [Tuber brumale]|nr:hypothetical protein HOY80DRAFT_1030774 [Tuber brumale]